MVARDLGHDAAGRVVHLVHEGHAALHDEDGEPALVGVVLEIGDEDVGGRGLLGVGELVGEELRDLLREVDEPALAEEVALELAREGAVLGEGAGAVVGGVARAF